MCEWHDHCIRDSQAHSSRKPKPKRSHMSTTHDTRMPRIQPPAISYLPPPYISIPFDSAPSSTNPPQIALSAISTSCTPPAQDAYIASARSAHRTKKRAPSVAEFVRPILRRGTPPEYLTSQLEISTTATGDAGDPPSLQLSSVRLPRASLDPPTRATAKPTDVERSHRVGASGRTCTDPGPRAHLWLGLLHLVWHCVGFSTGQPRLTPTSV